MTTLATTNGGGHVAPTMRETLREIARPVPKSIIEAKTKAGGTFDYIAWYDRLDLMDERAPAFSYHVVREWMADVPRGSGSKGFKATPMQHVLVRGEIPCADGTITREQIGVDEEPDNQYGTPYERAIAAGISRLTAAFGLGRALYGGEASAMRQRAIILEQADPPTNGNGATATTAAAQPPNGRKRTPIATTAQNAPESPTVAADEPEPPAELPEGYWRAAIEALANASDLAGFCRIWPKILNTDDEYRRTSVIKLWANAVANIGGPDDLEKMATWLGSKPWSVPSAAGIAQQIIDKALHKLADPVTMDDLEAALEEVTG